MNLQVTCKFCQRPQEYAPGNPPPKRYRKVCEGCGQRFTIPKEQAGAQSKAQLARSSGNTWTTKLQSKDPRLGYLDDTDRKILERLGQCDTQPMAARAIGITRQAVWWRVKAMINLHVLEELPTYPRSYRILPEIATSNGVAPVALIHDLGFRSPILAEGPRFDEEKIFLKSYWKETWWQRKIEYKHVKFDINETNTPNVFFHVTGAGSDTADAINNAKCKALEAKDWLEDKLGITLGTPDCEPYLKQAHALPIYMSKEQHKLLAGVWNDRSDPAALFESKLVDQQVDELNKILTGQDKLQGELDEIKKYAPPIDAIKTLMDQFQGKLDGLEKATSTMAAAILQINKTLETQTEMNRAIKDSLERLAQAY